MSGISYPIAQHHIPEDWHLLQITVNFIMQSTIFLIDLYLNQLGPAEMICLKFGLQAVQLWHSVI